MKALVTEATGFVGRSLIQRLEQPRVLTRDPARAWKTLGEGAVSMALGWDPAVRVSPEVFQGVDAVFHLAGESVASGRWTEARKAEIRNSRVAGTRHLVEGLQALPEGTRPRVLVCASAVGIYGDRGDAVLDEKAEAGTDFLAAVCRGWEAEAARARALGVRVVSVRIGVVLGKGGGALARMLTPFKLGLGGRLGSGRQWMSWIHRDDLVGLMLHAATREDISGPMNAVAPAPVTNAEFTKALGKQLGRPTLFPLPGFALKLLFGEMGGVLLASQRAAPKVAEKTGYVFRYPGLAEALKEAVEGGA